MENLPRYVIVPYREPVTLKEIKFTHLNFEYVFRYDIGQADSDYLIYVFNDEKYLYPDLEQRFFMKIEPRGGSQIVYKDRDRPNNVSALLSVLSQSIFKQFQRDRK